MIKKYILLLTIMNLLPSFKEIVQKIPWQKISFVGKKFLNKNVMQITIAMTPMFFLKLIHQTDLKDFFIAVTDTSKHFIHIIPLFSLLETIFPYKNIQKNIIKSIIFSPIILLCVHLRCQNVDWCECYCKNPKAFTCFKYNLCNKQKSSKQQNFKNLRNNFICQGCFNNNNPYPKEEDHFTFKNFLIDSTIAFSYCFITSYLCKVFKT